MICKSFSTRVQLDVRQRQNILYSYWTQFKSVSQYNWRKFGYLGTLHNINKRFKESGEISAWEGQGWTSGTEWPWTSTWLYKGHCYTGLGTAGKHRLSLHPHMQIKSLAWKSKVIHQPDPETFLGGKVVKSAEGWGVHISNRIWKEQTLCLIG